MNQLVNELIKSYFHEHPTWLSDYVTTTRWEPLKFWKEEKVHGARSGEHGGYDKTLDNLLWLQKPPYSQAYVTEH